MGNQNSNLKGGTNTNSNNNENTKVLLENEIDYIATHYILTMNFQSLRNLYKEKYCNGIVCTLLDIGLFYFNTGTSAACTVQVALQKFLI